MRTMRLLSSADSHNRTACYGQLGKNAQSTTALLEVTYETYQDCAPFSMPGRGTHGKGPMIFSTASPCVCQVDPLSYGLTARL